MNLGRKSSIITAALGVKNSRLYSSLGVKQSHNPHMDVDSLIRNHTPSGIINNHSNSNDNNYQPIKGINIPNQKINRNRNILEKAHKIISEKSRNHFA